MAAGCGDDDDDTAAPVTTVAGSETTAAPAATTTPDAAATTVATTADTEATPTTEAPPPADERAFKVMVIGDETSTISFTVPEAVPAVQGALDHLPNVEVLHCDSAGDANKSTECQREAVDAGVAVVIASFGQIGQDQAVLTEAGIPVIGGADANAEGAFSLSAGLASYAALGVAAGEAGCTKVSTLYLDGAEFLADMVQYGADLVGAEEVARAAVARNTVDIAPQVTALTAADPDCIVLSVTPTEVVQSVIAIDQNGSEAQVILVGAILPADVREELGELAEGILTAEIALNPADDDPVIDEIAADIAAFDDDAEVTTIGILSWASAKLVEAALLDIDGDVTPAALMESLAGLEDVEVSGAIHPFSATTKLVNPLFTSFYNPWGLLYRVEDGVPVRVTPEFFSLVESLEGASLG